MMFHAQFLRSMLIPVIVAAFAVISGTAARCDESNLTEVARLELHAPTWAIAWDPNGSHLAALVGNDIVIWDTVSWTKERTFPVLRRFHVGLSLAYAGSGLLVGAPDQIAPYNGLADAYVPAAALRLWDPVAGSALRRYPRPDLGSPVGPMPVQDVFVASDDGEQIAAVASVPFDPVVFIYDTATGAILHAVSALPVPRPQPLFEPVPQPNPTIQEIFSAVAFSPAGHMVGVCGVSGRVYLIDASTGALARTFPAYPEGMECSAIAFSADGGLLATGRTFRRYVPLGRALLPGDRLSLEADTGNVRVWDVASGAMVASFANAVGATRTLSWSRTGSTLVAGDDGTLKRWTFRGAAVSEVATTSVPGGVFGTAFSPDGRLAVLSVASWIVIYR